MKETPYTLAAAGYVNCGWSPFALPRRKKYPPPRGFTGYNGQWVTAENVYELGEQWSAEGRSNIGIRLPDGVVGIDVDDYGDKHGVGSLAKMQERLGPLPRTWSVTSRGSGGSGIFLYRTPKGIWWKDVQEASIDLIHWGHRYVVAPPSIHPDTGNKYWWYDPTGVVVVALKAPRVEDLAELPEAWVEELQKGLLKNRAEKITHGDEVVDAWLEKWGDEEPCEEMAGIIAIARRKLGETGVSRHDTARSMVVVALRARVTGHVGVGEALAEIRDAFFVSLGGDRGIDGEWDRMVRGGVDLILSEGDVDAEGEDPCGDVAADFDLVGREDDGVVRARPDLYFTPKGRLLPQTTARAVTGFLPIAVDQRSRGLMGYRRGVWSGADEAVSAMLSVMLGENWTMSHRNSVLELLKDSPAQKRIDPGRCPHPGWVNFRNGMYNWRTGEVREHSPEYESTVQLGVEWDEEAECPEFEKFLRGVLPEDCVEGGFIWELLGYLMVNGNPRHLAVYLYGPQGRNGKGTLLRVYTAVVGHENVSAVSLESLSEDKFRAAELYGRLANIAGDIDARWMEKTAIIKQITGGDEISADKKYGQPFRFTPWAVPVFSGNDLFSSADTSDGWLARWVVLRFPNSFHGREDLELESRLMQELPGIARKAMEGVRDLEERGGFLWPESVREAKEEMSVAGDSVREWVQAYCALDPQARTPQADLWESYQTDGSGAIVGRNKFYRRLEQMSGVRRGKYQGERVVYGLRLTGGLL